jgi:PAS domain S-box-containing protein
MIMIQIKKLFLSPLKETFCFLLILFLVCSLSFSQQTKVDSLQKLLTSTTEDTTKVNLLNDIFIAYQDTGIATALKYAKQALELSDKINFLKGKASAYNNIGLYYFNVGKSSEALEYYLKANDLFVQIDNAKGNEISLANIGYLFSLQHNYKKAIEYYSNSLTVAQETNDSNRVAKLLRNIGMVFYEQGYYSKALDLHLKSLKILEKIKDKKDIAYVYGNIGLIYDSQNNYEKSLEYYNKSLEKSKEIGDKKGFAASLMNIGQLLYLKMNNSKKAIENLLLALNVYTELDDKDGISSCLQSIGDYYREEKNYPKALEYLQRAEDLNKERKDKNAQSNILGTVGDIYYAQNNYAKALESYRQCLSLDMELGIKDLLKQDYEALSNVYEKMGDFKQAYSFHKQYSAIKDSIISEEGVKQMIEMQAKYETDQKEEEIKLLKKESEVQNLKYNQSKILMYSLVSVFVLLVVLIIFIFANYRHRQRVKQLNAEIALRESEEKYRDLANLLPQIMFEVDNSNNLTFINTAGLAMTGYFIDDLMDGMLITEIFAHDEKEKLLETLKDIYNGVETKTLEYSARRKDGTTFPVLCYFSPFVDQTKQSGLRGIAIDITEQKQTERRILTSIIEAEEKERKRVAKDLHDGLGPLLSSVKLYVNELQSADTADAEKKEMLKYTNELIDDAVSSTRTIANNLMPGVISDYGLVKALQSFCNKLNVAKSVNISFNTKDDSRRYDSTVEITLYRVLMELINNSIKHASAKNINITFGEENKLLSILFTDDGAGFDVAKTLSNPNRGMGLNNIINRVKSLQGSCEFSSKAGQGTVVKMEIDLKSA